jgi:tyrosine-specific transport protein
MSNQTKKIIYAVSTLSATIIGVGLFSLPYITLKIGIWVMLAYFLILGTLAVLVHLFFGKLASVTPDFKRLPGFAKFHLGNWGQKVALVSTISGLFGAILAYLIVGGEFLTSLLSPIFGGNNLIYTFSYFVLGAVFIFFGIKAISKIEFWGLILFFIILIVIFFQGFPFLKIDNLSQGTGNITDLFLPYGPILFSLWGAALIPEVEEMLGEDKKLLKKIIPISILIPIVVYLFFIFLILGICGPQTTETALTGLGDFLGKGVVTLALFFGILTTFTSFIAFGLTLKKVFWYDLKIKKTISWAITCFIPLILFLIGIKNFIPVISVVGGIMLGIDGILILLMYRKITPRRKILIYPLMAIFLGGIIYEIIYFIK